MKKLSFLTLTVLASASFQPPFLASSPFPTSPSSSGLYTRHLPAPLPPLTLKGTVGRGVQLLWNLTADAVGKTTSVSLNVGANVVVTGTTYMPVTQVSVLALDTGKILSKALPDAQFSYCTSLSADGSRTAVMGCPAVDRGVGCTLSVFKQTNLGVAPTWKHNIKGYQWWGAQGMKMAPDASIVAVVALKTFPDVEEPVPAELSWYDFTGQLVGNYSMKLSLGEVWANPKYVATREFNQSNGFLRILPTTKTPSPCSFEADYTGLAVSSSLLTILQPFVDSSKAVFVKQQSGGAKCTDNWQWPVPSGEDLIAVATSDVASVAATLNGYTISIYVFPNSMNGAPPKPVPFTFNLPQDVPVSFAQGFVLFSFSDDGVHLAFGIAGLGLYYMNVQTVSTSAPLHVFSEDNPCGILSLAVGSSSTDIFLIADFNQVSSVSPTELDCLAGGNGLSAFKIAK